MASFFIGVARCGLHWIVLGLCASTLSGCEVARLPVAAGTGPKPQLPEPVRTLIPTVAIAPAKGWPEGASPTPAAGLTVSAFARNLQHPRWLHVLPNGDVLVAESGAPDRPDDAKGIRGWIYRYFMRKSGAGGRSANRITLLRDVDGDGVVDLRTVFAEGLNSPFGMADAEGIVYVANTDAVLRFPYRAGETRVSGGTKVADLPGGTLNHHWTKGLIAAADRSKLYAAIGANSDHGEKGMDQEVGRAAIWEIDAATGAHRVFASGLRNPVGMAWEPETRVLWTVVNERDMLGSDLVPDYLTSVRDGGFYGWPYRYFGTHVDPRVAPPDPAVVRDVLVPDYALGPHTASLGLCWSAGQRLSGDFDRGMFIGQHGSWNRKPRSGYKVVFVPFRGGAPSGMPVDILTGFLSEREEALGRPVGVAIDKHGGLLVADDVGNTVWRVTAAAPLKR